MQSPPVEWALGIGYLALVDAIRDHGEPDGDTLTEVIRNVFNVNTPQGRLRFTAALAVGAVAFHRHIVKPEMRHR